MKRTTEQPWLARRSSETSIAAAVAEVLTHQHWASKMLWNIDAELTLKLQTLTGLSLFTAELLQLSMLVISSK
jgi:hypothetical protein